MAADRPFYDASGGGVTLSGGEPTAQADFLIPFARRCGDAGLDVGLQTCGACAWDTLEALLPALSFVHFDLKLHDDDAHRRHTGSNNRRVLANARRLVEAGAEVLFRRPIVPGFTDAPDDLAATAGFLAALGVSRIHLLRYHGLGDAKLARLNRPRPRLVSAGAARDDSAWHRAVDLLRDEGLEVTT